MDLPNPKELKALLKVCRDFSVETVEIGTLKIKFGEAPSAIPEEATATMDEDLVYWSAQPDPLSERLNENKAS